MGIRAEKRQMTGTGVKTEKSSLKSNGNGEIINITEDVAKAVKVLK